MSIMVETSLGTLIANAKSFRTGSKGFFGCGKLVGDDGVVYQCQFQAVEVGSKPVAGFEPKTAGSKPGPVTVVPAAKPAAPKAVK